MISSPSTLLLEIGSTQIQKSVCVLVVGGVQLDGRGVVPMGDGVQSGRRRPKLLAGQGRLRSALSRRKELPSVSWRRRVLSVPIVPPIQS